MEDARPRSRRHAGHGAAAAEELLRRLYRRDVPFIIEHQAAERAPVREGLYVFAIDAFGPQCASVRFSMFSEKDPKNPDTKAIDPKLFEQLTKP